MRSEWRLQLPLGRRGEGMVSGCFHAFRPHTESPCFDPSADSSGAFLETNLSPALVGMRNKMQGWSLGSLLRGGGVTPGCKA